MRLSIAHTTTYAYDIFFTGDSYMEARLRPLTAPGQQICREFRLTTNPTAQLFEYSLAGEGGSVSHFTLKDEDIIIPSELCIRESTGGADLQP